MVGGFAQGREKPSVADEVRLFRCLDLLQAPASAGDQRQAPDVSELDTAVDKLAAAGLINSPDYWKAGDYSVENVQALLIKWAASIGKEN